MKRRITEESVIFISVLKWFILATMVGGIVGLSTAAFLKLLSCATTFMSQYFYSFLFLPGALFLSTVLIKYLAPDAAGQGTDKVIEAVHKRSGRINTMVVPVKLAATVITIASGGSAGRIGPCAQIGGGLSSLLADLFRLDDRDRKKLVICGISAGFASVLGTPIAGAVFGVEVLFVGSIMYEVLFPSFVAGIIGFQVASSLGITSFSCAGARYPPFQPFLSFGSGPGRDLLRHLLFFAGRNYANGQETFGEDSTGNDNERSDRWSYSDPINSTLLQTILRPGSGDDSGRRSRSQSDLVCLPFKDGFYQRYFKFRW